MIYKTNEELQEEVETLRAGQAAMRNRRDSAVLVLLLEKIVSSTGAMGLIDYAHYSRAFDQMEALAGMLSDVRGKSSRDWDFKAKSARGLCTICRSPFVHRTHSATCRHIDADSDQNACRECVVAYSPIDWWMEHPEVEAWVNAGKTCERPEDEQQDFQRRQLRDAVLGFALSDSHYVDRITGKAGEWVKDLGSELR